MQTAVLDLQVWGVNSAKAKLKMLAFNLKTFKAKYTRYLNPDI
jgi:hypothetical protein